MASSALTGTGEVESCGAGIGLDGTGVESQSLVRCGYVVCGLVGQGTGRKAGAVVRGVLWNGMESNVG